MVGFHPGRNEEIGFSLRSPLRPPQPNRPIAAAVFPELPRPTNCGIAARVIAQETIDQIRDRANIADVVGESVKLERKGRSLTGLCPFHKEKSPSFHVNEDRGFYHCFGCKASGDVFKFVQETEGLTFIEAVRALAEKLNIDIEDDLSSEERRRRAAEKRQEQNLFEVNASAAQFFEDMMVQHPLASTARDELERRKLPYRGAAEATLRAFRVGYAPDGWEDLANFLRKAGHDLRAAENVGLIAKRRQGQGYYDRFRHRLMFAVIDLHGRVVAFSGRSLPSTKPVEGDPPAKYINSPESPIYKKRAVVFGLYQARDTLRSGKSCLMVEGNFDVVSLHAQGLTEAVAPLGTAFTVEQGKQIRRFTSQVTFLFDGDAAGKKATAASRQPARESGLSAKVARLPDGMDPDDFIRARGAEGMGNLIAASQGMLDYLISEVLDENFANQDAVGQAEKVNRVIELLQSEDDPNVAALAEQHADKLAGRLGVADAHTFRALRNSIRGRLRGGSAHRRPESTSSEADDVPREDEGTRKIGRAILGCLLDFPELLDSEEVLLYSNHMEGEIAVAVACLRSGQAAGALDGAGLGSVLDRFPVALRKFGEERLAAPKHDDIDIARVELFANLDKLRRMELTRLSISAVSDIERARQEGDYDQELELLKELTLRARQKRGL